MGSFEGKVVLITGGGTGIGRALAGRFHREGASLVLCGRRAEVLEKAQREIDPAGERLLCPKADIGREKDVVRLMEAALAWKGRIDVLVNNAAAMRCNKAPEDTSLAEWREVIDTNVTGTFLCCREAGKAMIRQKGGRIINIASMSGMIVNRYFHGGSYDVSKAAVIMLTKTLATEWAGHNIGVLAVAPGYYDTEANRAFFRQKPELEPMVRELIPMGRLGNLEELADLILTLAGPAANYMTGSTLLIDGGYTLW
jgi:NAD(P)-dependent dehydrogenase (short-subunit alcohol dehydrogenase family)